MSTETLLYAVLGFVLTSMAVIAALAWVERRDRRVPDIERIVPADDVLDHIGEDVGVYADMAEAALRKAIADRRKEVAARIAEIKDLEAKYQEQADDGTGTT